jgi:hypothetical protein
MAIREGRWNCPVCGSVQLGRNKVCTQCGRPRGDDVEFYLPEDEPEVTDAARLTEAEAGPDWHCEHCGADNRGDQPHCHQCGAPRGESVARPERFYAVGEEPRSDEDADQVVAAERAAENARAIAAAGAGISGVRESGHYQSPAARSLRRAAPVLGCAAAAAFFFFLIWFFTHTKPVTLTVAGIAWERTIQVERYKTLTQSDWDMPPDGRLRSSERRLHHHDQVLDHYESRTRMVSERVQTGTRTVRYKSGTRSKGNGYFEDVYSTRTEPVYTNRSRPETYREPIYRQVPVYRTWHTFDVDRWVTERTERAAGETQEVRWPEVQLGPKLREGGRLEKYRITLTGPKGKQWTKELPYERWSRLKVGDHLTARMTVMGEITEIE